MTEYDYSPEAYERYLATQNRIANWVDKTEQHRAEFQSAAEQDLPRSGPVSHSQFKRSSPPSHHQRSGQAPPRQLVIYPPPPESDSSDSYYEGPWPAPMPHQSQAPMLPQQPAFHPMQQPLASPPHMMIPPTFMQSPHRSHHRHRPHDKRRSHSHQSPAYYTMVSPPLSPGYQYPYPTVMSAGHQGYFMMPQYGGSQIPVMSSSSSPQPPRSAPPNLTPFSLSTAQPATYFQPQLTTTQQQGMAWSTCGAAPPPAYSMMSGSTGTPLQSPPYVSAYQPFVIQQPSQPSYFIPPNVHQRVYDLGKLGNGKEYRRSIG